MIEKSATLFTLARIKNYCTVKELLLLSKEIPYKTKVILKFYGSDEIKKMIATYYKRITRVAQTQT